MSSHVTRTLFVILFFLFTGCSEAEDNRAKEENPFYAAKFGELESLKLLMKEKPSLIKATNEFGETLLHHAAQGNQPEIIGYLVEQGADVNAYATKLLGTPLHYAAQGGISYEAAKVLIELGADINARPEITLKTPIGGSGDEGIPAMYGESVLEAAARFGDYRLVELLIKKGAKVQAESPTSRNALHYACTGQIQLSLRKYPENVGNRKVIALLTKHLDINTRSNSRMTPLHIAAGHGVVDTVRYLVSTYDKIDLNASDDDGDTPLHIAVKGFGGSIKNRSEVIKVLIKAGADVNRINSKKLTPLQLAEKFGHQSLIDAFKTE